MALRTELQLVSVLVITKGSGIMPLFKVEGGAVSGTQPQFLATDLLVGGPLTGRLSDVYVGVLVGGEQEDLEAKQLHEASKY